MTRAPSHTPHFFAQTVQRQSADLGFPEPEADLSAKPESIEWGRAFRDENFTQIPNALLNLVRQKRLIPFDLVTYGYFLSKAGAMEAGGKRDYTIVPEMQTAADLNCCVRTIRASVARLLAENLIERRDTPGFTRTRMLVKVEGTLIVQRPRAFPPRKIRNRVKPAVPLVGPVPEQSPPAIPAPDDDEMPF